MSIKLLADKYIELNVQSIAEISSSEGLSKEENLNYILLFCRSGKMEININKRLFNINENDILLINKKEAFEIKKGSFSCLSITFNGSSAEELINCTRFVKGNKIIHDNDSRIGYFFYKMYHAYHEAEFLSLRCLGLVYELFYELTKSYRFVKEESSNQEKHIEMAKEFINQNYSSEISIVDVARKVGVTSNYLANIFTLYTKKTPKLYLTQVRMEQAKSLLATRKYKVKEVGKMVGYKNQLHFSSEFKKYTGKSPLQYSKEF